MGSAACISVGIPVYNQAATIAETVRSMLAQTVAPREIVVAENHSTDGTDRVLAQFGDRLRIVRPPRHLPMTENWNFLVGHLTGDWFALLSGDDVALPIYVETLCAGIGRADDAVLVRGDWQIIDGDGRRGETRLMLGCKRRVAPPETLYESLLGPRASFAAFAARRAAWQAVGGFPEALTLASDWGFWIRLAPTGAFIYEPRVISLYRAGYRPGLAQCRALTFLRDDVEIQRHLIPDAAARLGVVDHARLEAARRQFLRWALDHASMTIAPAERAAAVALLHLLADHLPEHRLIDRFAAGRAVRYRPIAAPLRRLARHALTRWRVLQWATR